MTRDEALHLTPGQTIYHSAKTNADGSPLRARINGKALTRKRDDRIHIPAKHGLRTHFYLNLNNIADWQIQEPTR